MKIAFIGGRDIREPGGIEVYMLNLASELVKLGQEPIVFCESNQNKTYQTNGFTVIQQSGPKSHFFCKPFLGLKSTLKVIMQIKDVDVIHYNAWPPSLSSPLARLFGFKCILMGHGFEWRHSKYSKIQKRILKLAERFTAHLNRNIILCSREQVDYFNKYYHKTGILMPTATHLPNSNKINTSDILNKYQISPKKYFLFMGRLGKVKNVDCLISAFNNISPSNYQLVIAGNNTNEPEYVAHLHKLATKNPNIIFTGSVSGDDKDALLRDALAFCLPSTSEGMSIALLEAISYKIPVILSDIEANTSIVTNHENAIWVKPESIEDLEAAIKYTIDNKIEMQNKALDNYTIVEQNYTWDKVAQRYLDYIKTLR